jgi:hypothetical protein
MAHRTYGDIDFKHSIWKVQPKAGWSPKTKNSKRDVPVDCGGLTQAIQARMRALDKTKPDLVFPNSLGQPNYHLLRIVKRVAKRAA